MLMMAFINKNPYQNKRQKRMVTVRINVAIVTIIGLWSHERKCPQPLTISLTCHLKHVRKKRMMLKRGLIVGYFQNHQPKMLEKAAFDLATTLRPFLRPKERMSILIKKPQAIKNAQWAGVEIDLEA